MRLPLIRLDDVAGTKDLVPHLLLSIVGLYQGIEQQDAGCEEAAHGLSDFRAVVATLYCLPPQFFTVLHFRMQGLCSDHGDGRPTVTAAELEVCACLRSSIPPVFCLSEGGILNPLLVATTSAI